MRRIIGTVMAAALLSIALAACNADPYAAGRSPYSSMDDPNQPGASSGGGGGGGGY